MKNMFLIENYNVKVSRISIVQKLSQSKVDKLLDEINQAEQKKKKKCEFLIIDAEAVAGLLHLKACIHYSIKAFQQKNNIANSLKTEILLYLSGYRQISKAISKIGINPKSTDFLFIQILPASSDKRLTLSFEEVLKNANIEIKDFFDDINYLPLLSESKIRKNLNISENEITLLTSDKNCKNREEIIEKLAIEKSALLNINK
ncbi:MAG: hypothetical protein GNW80_01760 [Asgard group archaeon]|nr:hypothetical protein [Asgard group archaeon]